MTTLPRLDSLGSATVEQRDAGHFVVRAGEVLAGPFKSEASAWHWCELQTLPWTGDLLTPDEFQAWVASRKEAGAQIDIETCELGRWHAYDLAPYGECDLPDDLQQVGTNRYVRSPESRGWIHEGDLPRDKWHALYDRIERMNARWQAEQRARIEEQVDALGSLLDQCRIDPKAGQVIG